MQIFVFFLYNRAGNKTDEIYAQNVLTEACVSRLRASVRTLDRQGRLSFLPPLSLASRLPGRRVPLLSSLLSSLAGLHSRQRPRHNAQSSESQESPDGLGDSRRPCLAALQPGQKLLRDFPPPCLSLALLQSRRRRWRARLSPSPRFPACPCVLPSPASRAPFLPLPQVKQVKAGAVAGTGTGSRESGAGNMGRGVRAGARAGAGPATTHRKNSGEEGLSLVEPASLKPELASFSHLTL